MTNEPSHNPRNRTDRVDLEAGVDDDGSATVPRVRRARRRRRRQTRAIVVALLAVSMLLVPSALTGPVAADGNEAPGAPVAARSLTVGGSHTCVVLDDGAVKCWGSSSSGQLGYGDEANRGNMADQMGDDLPAVDLGTGRSALAVSAGFEHTCALLDDGSVKCWGSGLSGRLGYGDNLDRGDAPGEMGDDLPAVDLGTGRTAVAIAAGNSHTCALLDDGSVKCWGLGISGRLGYGDQTNRGSMPNQMGDNLPVVALGTGRTAVAIAAGNSHTCALLDDGSVKCWGRGASGRLGYGDQTDRGSMPNQMGDNLPAVALGTGRTAAAITAGEVHTCALLDNGSVKCWGFGAFGRLGYGDTATRGDAAGEMGDNLPAVDLGTGRTAVAVATESANVCALLDNGSVKCWGRGINGRLGYGDTADRGDALFEMGDDLPTVDLGTGRTAVAVTTGYFHTCAVLDTAQVKCWGWGAAGRLGYGDTADRGDAPGEMGDDLPPVSLGGSIRISDEPPAPPRRCAGRAVTVDVAFGQSPTNGDDVIIGTDGDDVIDGLGGADIICGGRGNDRLIGGPGNDRLIGGPGNDRLIGGAGNDRLVGGAGNDRLAGGGGNDRLVGGAGNDRLAGGAGGDILRGGPGDDRLVGGSGNDTCLGGRGSNTVRC